MKSGDRNFAPGFLIIFATIGLFISLGLWRMANVESVAGTGISSTGISSGFGETLILKPAAIFYALVCLAVFAMGLKSFKRYSPHSFMSKLVTFGPLGVFLVYLFLG